jgi:hypothetical protein
MFDYASAKEIQLLRKLRARGTELCVTSNQRLRLELLGLITDGPQGMRLTAKGERVANVSLDDERQSEFEPLIAHLDRG